MDDDLSRPPHPPYDEIRSAAGDHPDASAAIDDLHAAMNDPAPRPDAIRASVDRARAVPALEATIANWWDSPRVQNWVMILTDAGL
jgi:hypothetical protein